MDHAAGGFERGRDHDLIDQWHVQMAERGILVREMGFSEEEMAMWALAWAEERGLLR